MKRFFSLLLVLGAALSLGACEPDTKSAAPEVYVVGVDGKIDARAAGYVERVVSEAGEAEAVAIELDTPGGSLDHSQRIVEALSNAQETPLITYVRPQVAEAASAGTFIVMASDVAAMAPQTRLGAATPVTVFGGDIPGTLGEKVTNDAAALIRGLAEAHGRNEEWAEDAVRESASANAEEALEMGVVEHVEPDLGSVLEAAHGERVEPKGGEHRPGGHDRRDRRRAPARDGRLRRHGLRARRALGGGPRGPVHRPTRDRYGGRDRGIPPLGRRRPSRQERLTRNPVEGPKMAPAQEVEAILVASARMWRSSVPQQPPRTGRPKFSWISHIPAAKRPGSSPSTWSSPTSSRVLKEEALALNPSSRRPTSSEDASSRRALAATEGWTQLIE